MNETEQTSLFVTSLQRYLLRMYTQALHGRDRLMEDRCTSRNRDHRNETDKSNIKNIILC